MAASAGDISFACRCGTVAGILKGPKNGTRALCFCRDCRAAVWYFDSEDPGETGIGYYQTTPDRVEFTQGQDRLGLMTLRNPGLFRWYATCCNAPLFNTMVTPGVPFASIYVDRVETPDALGPVVTRVSVRKKNGKRGHEGLGKLIAGMIGRTVPARLSGRWRQTPFFDIETRTPRAERKVLTAEERRAVGLRA